MKLKDKVAIVTGGGSGFGAAVASLFAAEGAHVVINDLDGAAASQVAQGLDGARAHEGDCSDHADVRDLVGIALEAWGRVDIMVANAGYSHVNRPMLEVEEDEFDRIFDINVKGIYLAAREVVPPMRAQGGGVFLVTASTAGLRPRPGLTWYNGSKGAAITLAKSMAVELAPDRIRVNALCPVAADTPMLPRFLGGDSPEHRARFLATVPMNRFCQPDDLAHAALYLASDQAEFITGLAMEIDGGRCV